MYIAKVIIATAHLSKKVLAQGDICFMRSHVTPTTSSTASCGTVRPTIMTNSMQPHTIQTTFKWALFFTSFKIKEENCKASSVDRASFTHAQRQSPTAFCLHSVDCCLRLTTLNVYVTGRRPPCRELRGKQISNYL